MVPTVLFGYFVLLLAVMLVATGAVAWYWGVAIVVAFVALERIFFRNSHSNDGDDELDKQHDAHLAHPNLPNLGNSGPVDGVPRAIQERFTSYPGSLP
jgi:hypothetical protein